MNKTLIAGLILTAAMLLTALFGPLLAPHDPKDQVKIEYVIDEKGDGSVIAPPVAPGADYPLGTDKNGYDILTKLLYGAKYTVFLSVGIALARVAIGGGLGMLLGYYGKPAAKREEGSSVWSMLNGIPIFVVIWLSMIGITMNPVASPFMMSLLLAIVLTIVGIPSIVSTVKAKTLVLRERQYVTASQTLGAGGGKIIRSHLFPHLKESFLILTVQEIILVLTLFGQLALFRIFVGGTTKYFDPVEFHSRTNEWGGLIGQARGNFYANEWIFYSPLAAYVILIVGFHLLSKGLEERYNRMFSKFSHL
ncbi:ABC transporter permease subunit [Paenibacillus sp. LHD-117]|uniref:ABC transporter permease n=1 Tax=Paenibacillus sp. LHD-117 TaxID=3071412 RepID=UPI0027DF21FD|nr:ABC transporter permease subunit [Paenibacillus sp. LHD-117]MDQ6422549.1 ABC transporter permease subunit [Paenibacillus sp. LHD-117]